mgnify:CR=1 FL=1
MLVLQGVAVGGVHEHRVVLPLDLVELIAQRRQEIAVHLQVELNLYNLLHVVLVVLNFSLQLFAIEITSRNGLALDRHFLEPLRGIHAIPQFQPDRYRLTD